MALNEAIDKALLTWRDKDNPLHFDHRHPAIKLAGEAGEILDLYGKDEYKPGFDWWICKYCKSGIEGHIYLGDNLKCNSHSGFDYTSLVLDELGDFWYYLRILAYQTGYQFQPRYSYHSKDLLKTLSHMSSEANQVLFEYVTTGNFNYFLLSICYWSLLDVLDNFDFIEIFGILDEPIDYLTELNYIKLNSDKTANGWKDA